jgi:glycosyltransferase involved in cell wall biosynthesis
VVEEKRVDLLLNVARTPGISLTIVGDGPVRAELESLFSGTHTQFLGYLYGDDLAAAYASADAFFFTGLAETFGQVVQEAMASGLPCVVGNRGGVTDLVEHGRNGFICEPDPASFARAAERLRDDPVLALSMGAESVRRANRPWETVLGELEAHYARALRMNSRLRRFLGRRPTFVDKLLELRSGRFQRNPDAHAS